MIPKFTPILRPAEGPGPITPTPPPGADKIMTMAGWVMWGCALMIALGLAMAIVGLATSGGSGRVKEHMMSIGLAVVAMILLGAIGTVLALA